LFCVKRRAGTAQIKVAPVDDAEALLHVSAATNKQGKGCGKQVFVRAVRTRTLARFLNLRNPQNLWLNLLVSNKPFCIIAADHTGITVSNLEKSLEFWRDVLGLEFSHTAHQTGELAKEITGIAGAEIKLAVLKTPSGHKIELLEYLAPPDHKHPDVRPCNVGHVHVALLVDDLDAILDKIAASGWRAAGEPQTLKTGPNAGKRVVYVRDPDGTTIELMQPPKSR
jgi:catechol 2,3-dioxygenase-like lactoylglutathione lyase family enzyme